jgi:hypothetical protein
MVGLTYWGVCSAFFMGIVDLQGPFVKAEGKKDFYENEKITDLISLLSNVLLKTLKIPH